MQDTTLNTGSLKTTGVDLNVNYHTDLDKLGLGDNGSIAVSMVGTWLDSLVTQPLQGGPSYDPEDISAWEDPTYGRQLYDYYGHPRV